MTVVKITCLALQWKMRYFCRNPLNCLPFKAALVHPRIAYWKMQIEKQARQSIAEMISNHVPNEKRAGFRRFQIKPILPLSQSYLIQFRLLLGQFTQFYLAVGLFGGLLRIRGRQIVYFIYGNNNINIITCEHECHHTYMASAGDEKKSYAGRSW